MAQQTTKIALVTGGSQGIGAAIGKRLARDGFTIALNYVRHGAATQEVCRDIADQDGFAVAFQADVSKSENVTRLFNVVEAQLGTPEVVVNNAGILSLSSLADVRDDDINALLDVNVKGVIYCLREAMKRLQQGARIINLSSTVVAVNMPHYGVYTATKAAVDALTAIAAKELRGRSITVNAVAPGPTATDLFLEGKSDDDIKALSQNNPLERLATAEDIAKSVSFLAGPDGGWVNGQTLRVNGGMA